MSGFLLTAGFAASLVVRDDTSACEWATSGDLFGPKLWDRIPADDYFFDATFESEWWPSRSSLMGGWDGEPSNLLLGDTPWWSWPSTRSGCNGRLGFVGYTRDAYGSVLGGCTVKCFRTSSDELVSTVTSDANGYYIATSPYIDAHYLVVQKPDAVPPVAGASLNTVTPA
jgi:hypothetical protein